MVIGGVAALDQRIGLRYTMSPMRESENRQLPAPPPQAGRTRGHVVLRRLPGISPVGMYRPVHSLYHGMVRIVVNPTWARWQVASK